MSSRNRTQGWRFVVPALALSTLLVAHAELPEFLQHAISGSTIEAALYRMMQLPGGNFLYPRPPKEAQAELGKLLKADPGAAELYSLRAMTDEAAKGERFLAVAGDFMWMIDIAKVLKARLGTLAKRVPTRELPNWVVRLASLKEPAVKQIIPELGIAKNGSNAKAKRILGWTPRTNEECILATAESLAQLGLLKHSSK